MTFKTNCPDLLYMKMFSQDIWAKLHVLFYDMIQIFTKGRPSKSTIWNGEKSNCTVEKPGKHCLSLVNKLTSTVEVVLIVCTLDMCN